MITIAFRVNPSEKEKIMMDADIRGINLSWIMRRLVHLYLTDEDLRRRVICVGPQDIVKGEFGLWQD